MSGIKTTEINYYLNAIVSDITAAGLHGANIHAVARLIIGNVEKIREILKEQGDDKTKSCRNSLDLRTGEADTSKVL